MRSNLGQAYRPTFKIFPWTNALAYLEKSVSDEGKKSFISVTTGVNVIKLVSFVPDIEAK